MSELLLSLVTFAVIATASPGGATTLATSSGMRFGLTRSLPLPFGIAVGLASLVGVVRVGSDPGDVLAGAAILAAAVRQRLPAPARLDHRLARRTQSRRRAARLAR
jgi:hypothetical protein